MKTYEYKVTAAPHQGRKAKGVKSTAERFALSMGDVLNDMAEDGWEYVRAETLPCDERRGLTGTQTTFQNVLIFRRAIARPVEAEVVAPTDAAVSAPPSPPPPPVADLERHDDADPVSEGLGDTLRATRMVEPPATRRLGPAQDDDD